MATTVTKIIDPDNGAGTDYTSLSAWEAAQQGDLTGVRDEIAVARCRSTGGTADTTALVINGWTTSATQYIKIWTDPAETYRHAGKWDATKYRLYPADAYPIYITQTAHIIIDGLQIGISSQTKTIYMFATYEGGLTVSNCIVKGTNDASHLTVVISPYWAASTLPVYLFNNIFYAIGTYAGSSGLYLTAGTVNMYNVTIANAYYAVASDVGSTINAKNCYAQGTYAYAANGTLNMTTCASSDASGTPAGLRNIALNTTNFTNVTAGSEDFHLPVGSALIGVGTDTHAEGAPLNFTTDIDGQTRTTTWDVGADEYVVVATNLNIAMIYF